VLAIRGYGSEIARELAQLVPGTETIVPIPRNGAMPVNATRYLFCAGVLYARPAVEQREAEIEESRRVNLWQVTDDCERILSVNDRARICLIGSESGYAGSYDGTYAAAKRELHSYVETKRLRTKDQQLVCIAPSIIEDCGMTQRREDRENLERRRQAHPKGRFLWAYEVARLVHFCLYVDDGYLCNVTIRMNGGGAHTRC
jgi:NAD(P)-dependent dehydrogenase (short-subunit alcohol dehydrogenase family)